MSLSAKHYLWLGHLAVLGLVVWAGLSLALGLLGHRLEEMTQREGPVQAGPELSPRLRPLADYEALARENMFGAKAPEAAAPAEGAPEAPAASPGTSLRLRGTIVDPDTGFALAVLEEVGSREQELYRPGQRIGSAELVRVERDQVVLREDGRTVRLKIFEEEVKDLPWGQPPAPDAEAPAQEGGLAQRVGPNKYVVSRESLNDNLSNLNRLMADLRIEPYFKGGQPHGYKLIALQSTSPVYQLGLRRGDVILKVNDVSVRDPQDLGHLYRQIQQLETVTLDVERAGRAITLTYSLK